MAPTDSDLMMFHAAELLDAHEHLDRAFVPREAGGEKLSISQRCKLAADMVVTLVQSQQLMSRLRA